MLILLSPSKTLDYQSITPTDAFTRPDFLDESQRLIKTLRNYSRKRIAELMDISKDLAALNHERYQQWALPFSPDNARQAIFAFKGDVYNGLKVEEYNEEDIDFAQQSIRILSGLYGILRPLDLIQPYRLEMGVRLKTRRGNSLYDFWGKTLTQKLNAELAEQNNPVVLNLASQEYFGAIQPEKLKATLITCHFKEFRGGEYKNVTLWMKQARGLMASWIVQHRITDPEKIKDFDRERYTFNAALSTETEWYFTRTPA